MNVIFFADKSMTAHEVRDAYPGIIMVNPY